MCSPMTAGPQRIRSAPFPRYHHDARRTLGPNGFTLVELVAIVGIIAFLISIVMPAVQVLRRGAQETACLTNLHLLGIAIHTYLNDNHEMLPDASSTNSWDSPYSPRGLADRGMPGHQPGDQVFGPTPNGPTTQPARPTNVRCLPPIGQLLDQYMVQDGKVWRCPTQRDPESPTKMRSGAFKFEPGPNAVYTDIGEFRPGYMYLSTKEYQWFIDNEPDTAARYWMYDWIVRNVGGLSLRGATPANSASSSSDVALFMDYGSTFHAKAGTPDVYTVKHRDIEYPNRENHYQSNVLYLDGHVDTKPFRWQGGLLNVTHRGIAQNQMGLNYTEAYAENYRHEFVSP